MTKSPEEILSEEYCRNIDSVALKPLKWSAYLRFETKDGRLVEKFTSTIIRSIFLIVLGNFSIAYVLFVCAYRDKYLTIPEVMIVIYIAVLQNCTLINITFFNRNSGLLITNICIELDVILGIRETKFMRDIVRNTFVVLSALIFIFQMGASVFLYKAYSVSVSVHVIGSTYFLMVYLIFYDACFILAFYTFLSLRVHYMNIALIKLAQITPDYFADQLYFNGIFWRKIFDKLVTFHERADTTQFIKIFNLIFDLQRQIQYSSRFTTLIALTSLVVGTFIGVQSVILHKDLPDISTLRTASVTVWVVMGWMYLLMISLHIDIFYTQIERTLLICTYIQLKPVMCAQMLKLTKDVLKLLEVHEPRVSIYNMYYFNTRLVLQLLASIFVYITVQLQLSAAANQPSGNELANVTDYESKQIYFLY